MLQEQTHLQLFRKRSRMTQPDITFLLGLPKGYNISRLENGDRVPSTQLVLLYHLLFDYPLKNLEGYNRQAVIDAVVPRINQLIENLKDKKQTGKVRARIAFLNAAFTRLTIQNNDK